MTEKKEGMKIIDGFRDEPHVTSQQHADSNMGIFGGGDYVLDVGQKFKCESGINKITIKDGVAVLQGRRGLIEYGDFVDLLIKPTSSSAKSRTDLICIRYKKDETTRVESMNIVLIEGTEGGGEPAIESGTDVRSGMSTHDMILYRVTVTGATFSAEEVFKVGTNKDQKAKEAYEHSIQKGNTHNLTLEQFGIVSKTVTITPTAANEPTKGTITFGKTFKEAPVVQVTAKTNVPGKYVTGVAAYNITTTGCDIYVCRTTKSATALMCTAIGELDPNK